MTPNEIKERVLAEIGDREGRFITDADLVNWINDAQYDVVRKTGCLEAIGTKSLVSGTKTVASFSDWIKLLSIHLNGNQLTRTTLQELNSLAPHNRSVVAGLPKWYYVVGKTVYVYPTPAANWSNLLEIHYTKKPTEITAMGDTLEIDVDFHQALLHKILNRAHVKDGNLEKAEKVLEEYEMEIASIVDEMQNPDETGFNQIRNVDYDWDPCDF